jgi:hypothetical protein
MMNQRSILRLRSIILFISSTALNGNAPLAIVVFIVSLRYVRIRSLSSLINPFILLSKPDLAKKIRVYQNETDINDPEYVDGYTNIVEEHYSAFQAQSKVANEFLRRQEMAGLLSRMSRSSESVSVLTKLSLIVLVSLSCPEVSSFRLTISELLPLTRLLSSKIPLIRHMLP